MTILSLRSFSGLRKALAVARCAAIFTLVGCAAAGPKFTESRFAGEAAPPDNARIIVFRESDVNVGPVAIGIDGAIVGSLAPSGFIVADADPGERQMTASPAYLPLGESRTAVSVQAGQVSYFKISHRTERSLYPFLGPLGVAFWFVDPQGEFRIEAQPQTIARREIAKLKLSE
jgi:hypothetical protein